MISVNFISTKNHVVQSRKVWKRKVSKHRGWIGDFRWMLSVWDLIFCMFITILGQLKPKAIKQDVTHLCNTRVCCFSKTCNPTDCQKVGGLWILKILHEVDTKSQQLPKAALLNCEQIHLFIAVSIYPQIYPQKDTWKHWNRWNSPIHFGHETFTWEGSFWPLALSFLDETSDVVSFNTLLSALEWPKTLEMLQEMQQQRWKTSVMVVPILS